MKVKTELKDRVYRLKRNAAPFELHVTIQKFQA